MIAPTGDITREKAIEQYIVLRMRAEEIRRLEYLYFGIQYKRVLLPAVDRLTKREVWHTTRRALFVCFAALTDQNGKAQYIFESLILLFRHDPGIIEGTGRVFEHLSPILGQLRTNLAYPPCGKISAQLEIEELIDRTRTELLRAVMKFVQCMRIVTSTELRAIPDLRERLETLNLQNHPAFRNIFGASDA